MAELAQLTLDFDRLIDNRYQPIEWIGSGPMSRVLKARDCRLGDLPVAIKFLVPPKDAAGEKHRSFLEREMDAMVQLHGHSHVVQVKDFGWLQDRMPYLVMDFMPGGSLKDRLSAGPLTSDLQGCVLEELCDALDFVHEQGIVHLDLKPSNIFLDRGWHIRIGDFGVAQALERAYPDVVTAGTPGYMAPEQEDEQLPVDHRADIYALGIVTWEVLTGRRPDPGSLSSDRLHRELVEAIQKACSPDPSGRHESAEAFWEAIRTWLPRRQTNGTTVSPDAQFGHLVAQVPFSYRERVRRVLEDYTSVFGGRDRELEALDEWLVDSDRACGFVQAPAGRGKTALLVNWAREMQYRGWRVVFHPISIRYETADRSAAVRCLGHALAPLFDADPPALNQSPEAVQAQIVEWLRHGMPEGNRLLLVVDGLDEAIGDYVKSLLPGSPGPRVKVLVSARPLGGTDPLWWVNQLKWDIAATQVFDLDVLDRTDLVDVLRAQASDKLNALAEDAGFVDQLTRVSEGDPLTARILIDALRAGDVTAQSMSRRPPGLNAYLEEWMRQLEKRAASEAAWRLLGLCAVALGPLTAEDLARLAPDVFKTSHHVRQAVQAVDRFILGDGQPGSGYVFSHPRLREYFRDQLLDRESKAYRDAFIRYGKRVFGELPSKPCPAYVRRFWVTHLYEAGEWDELHRVVATSPGETLVWAEAHHSASGSYAEYLSDLSLGWKHADETGASEETAIARQVRYALIESSIHSLAERIPVPLLLALVEQAVWSARTGLDHALQVPDLEQRRRALAGLLPHLRGASKTEAVTEIGSIERELVTSESETNWESSYAAWDRSERGWRESNPELRAARARGHPYDQTLAMLELAETLPKGDRHSVLREAWQTARGITSSQLRVTMLKRIASHLPERGQDYELKRALETARRISCADVRPAGLECLEHSSLDARQRAALEQALPDTPPQAHATRQIGAPAESGLTMLEDAQPRLQHALEAAQAIGGDIWGRATTHAALAALVPCLAEAGSQEGALKLARTLPKSSLAGNVRAEALMALVPHLAEAQRPSLLEEALRAVRVIEDVDDRARALATLARYLPKALWRGVLRAEEVLQAKFEDWRFYETKYGSTGVLSIQTPCLSEDDVRGVRQALASDTVTSTHTARDLGLVTLAHGLANQGYRQEAVATARAIEDKPDRIETLAILASHLPEPFSSQSLEEAIGAVPGIKNWNGLVRALISLAPHIPRCRDRLYPLWCDTMHRLASRTRAELTSDIRVLVPVISKLGSEKALADTFSAIQDVGRWWP